MENKTYKINTVCDIFSLLGCSKPFKTQGRITTEQLTGEGLITFEQLRELIFCLKKLGIVDSFNEDRLDELVNEKGY